MTRKKNISLEHCNRKQTLCARPPERVRWSLSIIAHSWMLHSISENSQNRLLFLLFPSLELSSNSGFHSGTWSGSIKVKVTERERRLVTRGLENEAKMRWACSFVAVYWLPAPCLESRFQLSGQTEAKCLHAVKEGREAEFSLWAIF